MVLPNQSIHRQVVDVPWYCVYASLLQAYEHVVVNICITVYICDCECDVYVCMHAMYVCMCMCVCVCLCVCALYGYLLLVVIMLSRQHRDSPNSICLFISSL